MREVEITIEDLEREYSDFKGPAKKWPYKEVHYAFAKLLRGKGATWGQVYKEFKKHWPDYNKSQRTFQKIMQEEPCGDS